MIKKKLDLLEERIQAIDDCRPFDFLAEFITSIHNEIPTIDKDVERWAATFNHEILQVIESFESQNISSRMLGYQLYSFLLGYLRKTAIFSYAEELDIDPVLFKDQMGFLFKGKS